MDLKQWVENTPRPERHPAQVSLAATAILQEQGSRLVLGVEPDLAVWAALRLADITPGLLGDGSFSTFESGKRESWFALLGSTGSLLRTDPGTAIDGLEARAATFLAGASTEKLGRIATANSSASRIGHVDTRQVVVALCNVYASAEAGVPIEPLDLRSALASPETAVEVLHFKAAQVAFARGLLLPEKLFTQQARTVFPILPHDVAIEIGRDTVRQAVEARHSLTHACASANGRSNAFFEGAAEEYLQVVPLEPARRLELPTPLLKAALEQAFSSTHPSDVRGLVAEASIRRLGKLDEQLEPGVDWSAALLALSQAGAGSRELASLLSRNPRSVQPAWGTLPDSTWTDMILHGDPDDAAQVVRFLDPARRPELFWSLVARHISRLDLATGWTFLHDQILVPLGHEALWKGTPQALLELVRFRASGEIQESMMRRQLGAAIPLLVASPDRDALAWGQLLAESKRIRSSRLVSFLRNLSPANRGLAREYLTGVVVENGFRHPEAGQIIEQLVDERGHEQAAVTMLRAAHRAAARSEFLWQEAADITLGWITSWIDRKSLRLDRNAELSQPLQGLAVSLLTLFVDVGEGQTFVDAGLDLGGRSARWLSVALPSVTPNRRRGNLGRWT